MISTLGLSIVTASLYGSWHVLVKLRSHSVKAICLGQFAGGLLCLILAFCYQQFNISGECLNLILFSGFYHAIYLYLLAVSYKIGELSVIFPVSRSIGLFIICALSVFSESIFKVKNIGFILIIFGTFFINYDSKTKYLGKDVLFAILVGILTVFYSLIDQKGIDFMPAFAFSASVSLSTGIFLCLLIFLGGFFSDAEKKAMNASDMLFGMIIGITGLTIYSMFLFLLNYMSLSFAMANRQFSIIIGTVFGLLIFKESLNKVKVVSIILLFLGILFLNLF